MRNLGTAALQALVWGVSLGQAAFISPAATPSQTAASSTAVSTSQITSSVGDPAQLLAQTTLPLPSCSKVHRCYGALLSDKKAKKFCSRWTKTTVHPSSAYPTWHTTCLGYDPPNSLVHDRRLSAACSCLSQSYVIPTSSSSSSSPSSSASSSSSRSRTKTRTRTRTRSSSVSVSTSTSSSSSSSGSTPPVASPTSTLVPALPWNHDLSDLSNLVPKMSSMLFYAETEGQQNPYLDTMYVVMKPKFQYPTVILEHSKHLLNDVQCLEMFQGDLDGDGDNGLKADFSYDGIIQVLVTGVEAFQIVKQSWANQTELVLVTMHNGCFSDNKAGTNIPLGNTTRTYWLSRNPEFTESQGSGGSVKLSAVQLLTEEGIESADLVWGQYTPPSNNNTGKPTTPWYNPSHTNQTIHGSNTSQPCLPSNQTLDGLYTADACDPNFDQLLDGQAGNISLVSTDFIGKLVSKAEEMGPIAEQGTAGLVQSIMLIEDMVSFLGAFATALNDFFRKLFSWDLNVASPLLTMNLMLEPDVLDSPWGPAYELLKHPEEDEEGGSGKSKRYANEELATFESLFETREEGGGGNFDASITVYCVDCGIKASLGVTGGATFSLIDGVTSLRVGIVGGVDAGLELGIVAEATYKDGITKNLLTVPIAPFFYVPGIISVGPMFQLDAELSLEVGIAGEVLAGIRMEIGPFKATMDFINDSKTGITGWDPKMTPIFEAKAEVSAAVQFSLPFRIGVGVNIPIVDFSRSVALVDKPGIRAEIGASISTSLENEEEEEQEGENDECENGIRWNINFVNDLGVDVFSITSFQLHTYTSPLLASSCYRFGGEDPAPTDDPDPEDDPTQDIPAPAIPTMAPEIVPTSPGDYVTLEAVDGNYTMYAGPDGNLYVTDISVGPSSYFAVANGSRTIVGDAQNRYFHYYVPEYAAYGVSRLRLSPLSSIPGNARMLAFLTINHDADDKTPPRYFGFDSFGTSFWMISCAISGQGIKVFATNAYPATLNRLKDPDLAYTVMGGSVEECYLLGWAPGPKFTV